MRRLCRNFLEGKSFPILFCLCLVKYFPMMVFAERTRYLTYSTLSCYSDTISHHTDKVHLYTIRALCSFALDPRSIASGDSVRRSRRRVEALVGQCRQAVTPVSSRTPTSRSRFATADPPGRVRESHRGAVRAANGTRAGRRSHPRIRGRPHARP